MPTQTTIQAAAPKAPLRRPFGATAALALKNARLLALTAKMA